MTADNRSECLVMAKPGGPMCNLRCDYCYYLDKSSLYPGNIQFMGLDLLERYITERFEASTGPITHFEWHGGEPTLLGLDYFKAITSIQSKMKPKDRSVSNGLQTNGYLLDEEWAEFLAREGFSVGLSLDGPEEMHDRFRKTIGQGPAHANALNAFHLLKKNKVFCNVLCVLHSMNAAEPDRLYDFFKSIGAAYIQFLPLVKHSQDGQIGPPTASPEIIGNFLCRIFDRWISADVGRIVIQTFDEALRPVYGAPHALCVHRETCGDVAVLEHDGSFYACDHFVDPDHLIGNIRERKLADLAADHAMTAFGKAKKEKLPRYCLECEALSSCNGGCPKDRFTKTPDGDEGLNYLCKAYKKFFIHSKPELTRLADHMKSGIPLRAFKAV